VNRVVLILLLTATAAQAQDARPNRQVSPVDEQVAAALRTGKFHWQVGPLLLAVDQERLPPSEEHPWLAVKDPSVVRHGERWHLFCTLRKDKKGDGRIRIGYTSFADWADAKSADFSVLNLTMGYHGAPQIFYFEPHQKWYLIYQAEDETRTLKYGPCFSTNDNIADSTNWTLPEPLYVVPEGKKAGLDFWVICDRQKAHLFYTTLNGQMWRAETQLEQFPNAGWSQPEVALKADIFEASHTYKLNGQDRFLTVVEAQANKRRYFKAFTASRLDGDWLPLAASRENPLVSPANVVNQAESWATSYSHGEFLRAGFDQNLEIDPHHLRLLFQGANDQEYQIGNYGQIPWRLGLLKFMPSDDVE